MFWLRNVLAAKQPTSREIRREDEGTITVRQPSASHIQNTQHVWATPHEMSTGFVQGMVTNRLWSRSQADVANEQMARSKVRTSSPLHNDRQLS